MLRKIIPKLPMRNKKITENFYVSKLKFTVIGDYDFYLILEKDSIEIHFFEFKDLEINQNYGQVYIRTNAIENLYQEFLKNKISIHPNGNLELKHWGQKEFSVLDPDNNLLTFGEAI